MHTRLPPEAGTGGLLDGDETGAGAEVMVNGFPTND